MAIYLFRMTPFICHTSNEVDSQFTVSISQQNNNNNNNEEKKTVLIKEIDWVEMQLTLVGDWIQTKRTNLNKLNYLITKMKANAKKISIEKKKKEKKTAWQTYTPAMVKPNKSSNAKRDNKYNSFRCRILFIYSVCMYMCFRLCLLLEIERPPYRTSFLFEFTCIASRKSQMACICKSRDCENLLVTLLCSVCCTLNRWMNYIKAKSDINMHSMGNIWKEKKKGCKSTQHR